MVRMAYETALLLPLAPLFAALLSGCFGDCDDVKRTVELTPEEYAQWSNGIPPEGMTLGDTPTGGDTASETAGTTTDTDTVLNDQQICVMVCPANFIGRTIISCAID